jgi:error-prone DNA polymerase
MGFYQPAQLVQDAKRHGVNVLPADVRYSDWDCTLEEREGWGQSKGTECATLSLYSDPKFPDLRLGLRMIKGMREGAAHRISKARAEHPFLDVQDLANRAKLDRHDLAVLAEAAALRGLAGHRHRARWEIAAVEKSAEPRGQRASRGQSKGTEWRSLSLYSDPNSDPNSAGVAIRPPSEVDDLRADYASTGLTLGRHPLALLRPALKRRRVRTAQELHALPHGRNGRACGLVTMRQRPMTASGTVFLTLEDETGCVNVVVWPRLFERQRAEILGSNLLAVDGVMETDGEVHHLIAGRIHDFSELAKGLQSRSRDFC